MTAPGFLEVVASLPVQTALVVAMAHWLGRSVGQRMQCRLWTGCYVMLLALVIAAVTLPHPRLLRPWSGVTESQLAQIVSLELQAGRVVFVVWLAGACISMCLFTYRMIQANRFLKTCVPIDASRLSLDELLDPADSPPIGIYDPPAGNGSEAIPVASVQREPAARVSCTIQLLSSTALVSPFCWQFHRPFIVLPDALLSLDREELRFIVRHEIEHLRTGHPLQLFLQRVVEVLFWFHPMVWWASYRTAVTREFACDDAAIESRSDISQYLRTLLTIVENGAARQDISHAPLAFGRGRSLIAARAGRLVAIARGGRRHPQRVTDRTATLTMLAVTAVALTLWLPINALASPHSTWSPWPVWTASVLHDFNINARDFELHGTRVELHEPDDDDLDDRTSENEQNAARFPAM